MDASQVVGALVALKVYPPKGSGDFSGLERIVIVEQEVANLEDALATTNLNVTTVQTLASGAKLEVENLTGTVALQNTKMTQQGAALLNKADLVSGKVPYSQLPEFPVGRKVNVGNKAARLALPVYTDLTIAYESDTGDAWGLDANADPAIDSNWSKLGNSQGIGVASFNGRTGNIGPQNGDYDASKIAELPTKRFVSETQIAAWDAKATIANIDTKISTQKTANDSVYATKISRGAINGLAPLDADSKVPIANLPAFLPKKARVWIDQTANRTVGLWYTNISGNEMELHVSSNNANDGSYFNVQLRANDASSLIAFVGNSINTASGGPNTRVFNNVTVPIGWQYSVNTANFNTRTIYRWNELG